MVLAHILRILLLAIALIHLTSTQPHRHARASQIRVSGVCTRFRRAVVPDLASDTRTRRRIVAARAEALRATYHFHCCAHFGGALGGEDAGIFGLGAVAPDGGFLLAH